MLEKVKKAAENEFVRFLLGGCFITLIYIVFYSGLQVFGFKARWAYWFAFLLTKFAGYIVNKFYVFRKYKLSLKETWLEAGVYFSTRGLTVALEYFLIFVLVEYSGFHPLFTEGAVKVLVGVINYFIGRYIVFKTA